MWAKMQLDQLASFYPGIVVEKQSAEMSVYRIPLSLLVSKNPLYIRIDCPKSFPSQRPNLVVLARVIHNDINPVTKVISNP
jgi:hypothetical protein